LVGVMGAVAVNAKTKVCNPPGAIFTGVFEAPVS
jgi:hypothetical protein